MKFNLTLDKNTEAVIDEKICINCGRCREICPTEAVQERQKTIYCMFPDCGEGKGHELPVRGFRESVNFSVESVCSEGCPLGIVPQALAALVRAGDIEGGYRLLEEKNPMAWVCGEICKHPCDDSCKRGSLIDRPVNTKGLERYVVSKAERKPRKHIKKFKDKIAVIGSGPAGLSAAFELSSEGYGVTVFEKEAQPGGSLSWGIPDFKIDKKRLAEEIDALISAGIEMRYDQEIGKDYTLDDVWREGFRACIMAIGQSEGVKGDLPGNSAAGVYDGVTAMLHINGGEYEEIPIGQEVVVIGGNEMAANTARILARTGKNVTLTAPDMTEHINIDETELKELDVEKVTVNTCVEPKQIIREDNKVKAVEFIKIEYTEGEDGMPEPNIVKGSEFNIFCDTVIFADERKCGSEGITNAEAYPDGRFKVNEDYETNKDMLFACGSAIAECGSAAEAIASGKNAARQVMSKIRGARRPDHDYIIASDDDRTIIYPDNISDIRSQTGEMLREGDTQRLEEQKAATEKYQHELLNTLRSAGIEEKMPHFKYENTGAADTPDEKFSGSRGRVAVIGGGLAGITASIDLAKKGYRPTLFEKQHDIGGRLRTYAFLKNIPQEVLDKELNKVSSSGIEVICDAPAGSYPDINELLDMGFSAVLFALGESGSQRPEIENIYSKGVLEIGAVINGLMAMEDIEEIGQRIIITGCDDETFDTARLLKGNYEQVTVLSPVGRESIEAEDTSIEAALEAGVNLVTGVELSAINAIGGRLQSIHAKTADRTIPMDISCDTVVIGGIGRPDTYSISRRNPKLEIDESGHITTDEKLITSLNSVFAISDCNMDAVEAGHFGANVVENFLKEGDVRIRPERKPVKDQGGTDLQYDIFQGSSDTEKERQTGVSILDGRQAAAEATRCMGCGSHRIDASKCMGCGICLMVCPANAIVLNPLPQNGEGSEPEQQSKEVEA